MTEPGPATPEQIHVLEQKWMLARGFLDAVLARLVADIPELAKMTGLSDASIVYDYAHAYLKIELRQNPLIVEAIGAAAITRLALRGQEIDDMTEFEKGIADGC
jgi:hypothetical protein